MNTDTQKWKLGISIALTAFVIGLLDHVTGFELNFFVFYFIPVAFAAWFIGISGAVITAVLCSILWFGTLISTGHSYSSPFFAIWNTSARFISFLAIGWSVSKIKLSLDNEKEISKRLNESIAERIKTEEKLLALNSVLEQRVRERTKKLQNLAIELIDSEEKERSRISALLHDDLQQLLAATLMHLDTCSENFQAASELDLMRQLLKESISKARNLSHELSPVVLHQSGLIAGLQWLARQMNEKFGLEVQLDVNLQQQVDFSLIQMFIFRSVQELLFNVVKHSKVKTARITLSDSEKNFKITVSDQGQGLNTALLESPHVKAGLGLMSVRERADHFGGSLEIDSSPGQGSRFTLTLPIGATNYGPQVE